MLQTIEFKNLVRVIIVSNSAAICNLATLHFRKQNIPNLMGVKFTDEHIMDFVLCAQLAGGKYNMLFGRDGLWSDVRGFHI